MTNEKKKEPIKIDVTHEPVVELIKVKKEASPPKIAGDVGALCNALTARLKDEDISVNSAPPTVQIGDNFVKNKSAMIVANVGPSAAPFNITAYVNCVVPKGNQTGLRLEILKNAVRAALKEPLQIGPVTVRALVTNEADSRAIGIRMSELTITMSARQTKLHRR
jgi:hypothetical protein